MPPVHLHVEQNSTTDKSYTYLDLFRHRKVASLSIIQGLIWSTIALFYFTISLESSKLGANIYNVFALSSLVELPGTLLTMYVCDRLGRKGTVLGTLFVASLFAAAIAIIPRSYSEHHIVLGLTFAILVKFFVNITYVGIYIWTFEMFPTVVRSQGLAVSAVFERVGALCAPFLITVLQSVTYTMPFIILAVVGILAAVVGLLLPETNGLPTRDVYEDFFVTKRKNGAGRGRVEMGVVNQVSDVNL